MHNSQSNHEPYPWDVPDDEEGTPANDEENHREAFQPSSLQAHTQPSTPATVQPSASERRFDVVRYENAWDKVPKSSRSTWPAIVKATKSRVDAALQSIDVEDPGDVSLSNSDVSPERLASRLKNEDLKKAGPAVSFCRYLPGTGRKAENVEAVAAYVIDLDGVDDEGESRVLSGLTGIACCAYTTWGSGWKKPGKSWRIIIPLATDVPGGALWKPVWALLNERLAQGLNDPTTKDACRLHFLPRAPAKIWFEGERVENGDVEWLEQSGAFFDPTSLIEEARRQLAEEARQAVERERAEQEREAQPPQTRQPANRPDAVTRALAYLEKCGAAIQGSAGSLTAMSVVGTVVRGFDLSANEAFSVLQPWNARCVPPWSEKELRHKIDDALTTPDPGGRPRGWLLNEERECRLTDIHEQRSALFVSRIEEPTAPQHDVVCLADVQREPIDWLWEGRIPFGSVVMLDGDPGRGKSTLMMDIAARATTGRPMPDGGPPLAPTSVLFIQAEDDAATTMRPRAEAANADLRRLHEVRGLREEDGTSRMVEIPRDAEQVARLIREHGARLVIIDPLLTYVDGQRDSHKDADMKRALTPLVVVAKETGAAIVCLRHLNKSRGSALRAGMGSMGIIGTARVGLIVGTDPQDQSRCVLAVHKANIAPDQQTSLAYSIEGVELPAIDDAPAVKTGRVHWHGATRHTADQLVAAGEDAGERGATDEACAILADLLDRTGGDVPVKQAKAVMREAGISDSTYNRARQKAGIKVERHGFQGEFVLRHPLNQPIHPSPQPIHENDGHDEVESAASP